ncbi:MAG: DEAD/DEAH box helicase [Candidatus Comchoanobacterales bacterium]
MHGLTNDQEHTMLMSDFKLPKELTKALKIMKYIEATPIQAEAIPPALKGQDVMGAAQTGTGKTAAFGIPLITKLMLDKQSTALIITPTRELASQVMKQLSQMLAHRKDINRALLIGGESMARQIQQINRKPRLVVGTPGRINDHLRNNKRLTFDRCEMLVLDETDRMFDMGFSIQIDDILKHLPSKRQTLMFSATMPKKVMMIAEQQMHQPVKISMDDGIQPAKLIDQQVMHVSRKNKLHTLRAQLDEQKGSVIVFMSTKDSVDELESILRKDGYSVQAIHGGLRQNKRSRVLTHFRQQKFDILVATDVAARGLDIPHVDCVINYDLPQMPEDFVHRIGRTARAGRSGIAITFVTPGGMDLWHAIECLLDPSKKRPRPQRKGHAPGKKKSQHKKHFGGRSGKSSQSSRRDGGNAYGGKNDHQQATGFSSDRKRDSDGVRKHSRRDNDERRSERSFNDRRSNHESGFSSGKRRDADGGRKHSRRDNDERRSERSFNDRRSNHESGFSSSKRRDADGVRKHSRRDNDDRKSLGQKQERAHNRHDKRKNALSKHKKKSEGFQRNSASKKRFDKGSTT